MKQTVMIVSTIYLVMVAMTIAIFPCFMAYNAAVYHPELFNSWLVTANIGIFTGALMTWRLFQ